MQIKGPNAWLIMLAVSVLALSGCPEPSPDPDPDAVYTVTIASGITGGTVSASPDNGPAGTAVKLTGTPVSDYVVDYYTVDDVPLEGDTFTLTKDVTVSAVFKDPVGNITIKRDLSETDLIFSSSSYPGYYSRSVPFTVTAPTGFLSYEWYVDNFKIQADQSLNAVAIKLSDLGLGAGVYSLTVVVKTPSGVYYSAARSFTVY